MLNLIHSNVESDSIGIDSIGELITIILDIYEKFLIKYLSKNINQGNNNENNKDNGAANGGFEVSKINGSSPNEDRNENINLITLFNDTITSIYFFCDLVKVNSVEQKDLEKVLLFIIKIISEIKGLSNEQKEILVRYYQEILLNYQIITEEDLNNVHFNFLRRIHKDNILNFIEHLIFGTILINTKKDILISSIKEFLNMVTLICLNNELNYNEIDKKELLNFYKFIKQICLTLQNKEEENEENINEKKENNGKEEDDLDTKINIAFSTIETYSNKISKKYSNLIKKDEDLNKKFKKLKQIIKDCKSS